jgi:isocitrate dehydrogenase kinase/phosphatase
VARGVKRLRTGYLHYRAAFDAITRRADRRFARRDWPGMRKDTLARLDIYEKVVDRTKNALQALLGTHARDRDLWVAIKAGFADEGAPEPCDTPWARTFFNSVHRRIFQTAGIDPATEFIDQEADSERCRHAAPRRTLEADTIDTAALAHIFAGYRFDAPFENLEADLACCAERLVQVLPARSAHELIRVEMLPVPFFRDMNAYLIGAISCGSWRRPLVFALGHGEGGVYVDAVLTATEQIRVLFSFSRAYFHVRAACPASLVAFLRELMPTKRTAELYIGLGFHKHGKTLLYRDLLEHRRVCGLDRFQHAAGQRGMVMIAFYMPQDDLIYKVIRDRFDRPKQTTRQQVLERYDYVFKHDRAGRLVDAQVFEFLQLDTCCFTEELLDELRREAARSVDFVNGELVLRHVYVERRVVPLDLYLHEADGTARRAAVIDYGRAIKDLARVDVFPGDLLIKNFGVTRLGRVVFYDYDELCPLTACNFRRLPPPRDDEELMAAEPWFTVGPNDVFPEEFPSFLGLAPEAAAIFREVHGDLLTPDFWLRTQGQIRAGHFHPIRPYDNAQRIRPPNGH